MRPRLGATFWSPRASGWELYLLWPFSHVGYELQPNLQLGHPINMVLVYVLMILPWLLAFRRVVTPLEILSARLDQLVTDRAACPKCS